MRAEIADLKYRSTEAYNLKQTLDPKADKEQVKRIAAEIKIMNGDIKEKEKLSKPPKRKPKRLSRTTTLTLRNTVRRWTP